MLAPLEKNAVPNKYEKLKKRARSLPASSNVGHTHTGGKKAIGPGL
jgi:hypothetical protein